MMSEKNVWETYEEQEMKEVFALAEDYKRFISENKTERACVKSAVAMAEARGYRDLREVIRRQETLKPQDKVYLTMMEKSIVLFHLGDRPAGGRHAHPGGAHRFPRVWISNRIRSMRIQSSRIWIHIITAASRSISGSRCRWRCMVSS